jgi:hypothetical protein
MELVREVGAPGVVPGEERIETLTDRICHLPSAICYLCLEWGHDAW